MQKIVKRLRELLEEGNRLKRKWRSSSVTVPGPEDQPPLMFPRRMQRWAMDCSAVLHCSQLTQASAYFRDPVAGWRDRGLLETRLAALESAIAQIEGGFVGKIRHLLHADIFDSMIEQAVALLAEGHIIPAAVLGRVVIERWLRDQAEEAGIAEYDTAKASKLNDGLKKAGSYSVAKWRQLQAHLDVGNAAAHGKADEFSADNIRQMLEYARANCL